MRLSVSSEFPSLSRSTSLADESIRLLWMWTVKFLVRIDDALDLFAEHAVGGIIGLLVNAIFARSDIIALDDVNTSVRAHLSVFSK